MSWLNSSLNTIKGQLTSLAQEVLAEGSVRDEEINPVQVLEESQRRNEELNALCASKDTEITALRKQIAELQAKSGESGRSSKSSLEKNASLEDSWIWEPENNQSDSSVKNDHEGGSDSSTGGELITIPLDIATNESGSYEKIPKNPEDRDQKLKRLIQENATLSEKVAQLTASNKTLNENLEELDSQHNDAIQKLLDFKNELQENFNEISANYEQLQKVHQTEIIAHKKELDALKKNLLQVEKLNSTYLNENKELTKNVETLRGCLTKQEAENITIRTNLELKEKHLLELIEKVENWENQYQTDIEALNKLQQENANLKKILEGLGLNVEELKGGCEFKDVPIKKHRVEDGFIVLEDDEEDLDGTNWKQRYQAILSERDKLLVDINERNQCVSKLEEQEKQVVLLRNRVLVLEEENKSYLDRIKSLQNSLLLDHESIEKEKEKESAIRENLEAKIGQIEEEYSALKLESEHLEVKIASLEEEKSNLESENQIHLKRISELEKVPHIVHENYEELKVKNQQLQESLDKLIDYQEEQNKIRAQLQTKVKALEAKVQELTSEAENQSVRENIGEDLRQKIELLEKEKLVLENENKNYLEKLEKLEKLKIVKLEEYQAIAAENCLLQENFQTINDKFTEYQEEQTELRKKLEERIEQLENEKKCKISTDDSDPCKKSESVKKDPYEEKVVKEKMELLEDQVSEVSSANQKLLTQIEEYEQFKSKYSELQEKITELNTVNEKYKSDIEKLKHKVEKCEANASDVESKLMMENVDLQKRLIDMESSLNQNQTETQMNKNTIFCTFDEIKELFATYLQADLTTNDKNTIETVLKSIRDKIWKIDILERNLKQMSDEISRLIAEKSAIEHERNTLQADILNYEIECGELMKNNEILLNELENYKRNKLETIHENNEDSIVVLEKQLEDCNNLNRTLEDEYKELNQRIEEIENEKKEYLVKIQSLKDINDNLNVSLGDHKLQLETLEAEKCNLIFELNEMKTDDKKSAMDAEIQEYRNKVSSLEAQIGRLSKDHADLVAAMQSQQASIIEYKKEAEHSISNLEKVIRNKESEIESLKKDLQQKTLVEDDFVQLQSDHEKLKIKLENMISEKQCLEEKLNSMEQQTNTCEHDIIIDNLNAEIEELKQNQVLSEECVELKKQIETLNTEKAELVQAVTVKHNENLQYYMELQRLGQLLQAEIDKSKQPSSCENCIKLQNEIGNISAANSTEIEKLKDQINFLIEKSDILTTNLLTEQTNQKLLQQEKSELLEKNNNLKRDLDRLREHLVELEEAHTQETLEMQKIIDETKSKMKTLEEDVANSSNAYTSASIRANQHAETLQAQYQLVCQQRDELAAKLSVAEDRESKNQAALVNLQCALEQFQREKENDILTATYKLRNELQAENEKQKQLLSEISALNQQLADANQGLLAAARLSDQLEVSQNIISTLKDEITKLQNNNQILDEKLRITESSQADKIEKSLIKSLIIGYIVSSNPNDKTQILRMITTVLGFDQKETDKVGLNKIQTGWFGGILNMGNTVSLGTDSLARAFVNFLEQESRPRDNSTALPNLLNIVSENSSGSASPPTPGNERKISETRTNQSAVQPILLDENVLEQFAPTRNSSSILKDILSDS